MKIYGIKYKLGLCLFSIVILFLDIIIILEKGFNGQFLVFIYVLLGITSLCGFFCFFSNTIIPVVTINNNVGLITYDYIADELYKYDRNNHESGIIYFDEIKSCEIKRNKLVVNLIYDEQKILYLTMFSNKQILLIKKEIDKVLNK